MIIEYTTKERELLARIMRAEALAEGDLGMLMVGNVVVNRALVKCLTFKNITTIEQAIYQPNQFVGTKSSLFEASPIIQPHMPYGFMPPKKVKVAKVLGTHNL